MCEALTVEELYKRLEDLIIRGYGDKKVFVSVGRSTGSCTGAAYSEECGHVEVEGC